MMTVGFEVLIQSGGRGTVSVIKRKPDARPGSLKILSPGFKRFVFVATNPNLPEPNQTTRQLQGWVQPDTRW